MPTVFTPNNDGVNDNWELQGIGGYTDVQIAIYNRSVELVYEYSGSGIGYDTDRWDGKFNGKKLPMSSYIFAVDLKDNTEIIKGIVSIKY
ncbi:MAG: hypothetical protein C0596_06350 [Marinilabiliales bacterium]|nr:MAG: hypothetical protein C0596_06350 [Marinilabiliales bacterium]